MKTIWNGFDTTPNILPESCGACLGSYGGDFIVLPCGHGQPSQVPLHVGCVVRSIATWLDTSYIPTPSCPICRKSMDSTTLNLLADRAYQNRLISFPGEDGKPQKGRICANEQERKRFVQALAGAVRNGMRPRGPTEEEYETSHYTPLIKEALDLVHEIRTTQEGHHYTLGELEKKQDQIEDIEDRLTDAAGKVAQYAAMNHVREEDAWEVHPANPSPTFSRLYDLLANARGYAKDAERILYQKKEALLREEEERKNVLNKSVFS